MRVFATSFCLLASISSGLGHATFQQLWVDGVDQEKTCVRDPPSNSPVVDVTSEDVVCNVGGASGVPGICAVDAGSKVIVEMHQHNDRDCSAEAIGGAHHGPVIIYMSKVEDSTTATGADGSWFKVAEDGYDAATQTWGEMILNKNCGKREFTVPSDLASGDYLIRAEVIALHAAGSPGGAQLYMSCYQVHVEGSGSATPAGVKFPGAYSATDPGILIDIYRTIDDYIIPGPVEVYEGNGSASPPPTSSGSAPTPSVSASPSSSVPNSSTVTSIESTLASEQTPIPSPNSTGSSSTSTSAPTETTPPVQEPATPEPTPIGGDVDSC